MTIRTLVAIAVACVAFEAVQAIVCTPTTCATVRCDTTVTTQSCAANNQEFDPKGGFCGCCAKCITIIPDGERCLVLNGVPPSTRCGCNSVCAGGICKPRDNVYRP